MSDQRTPPDEQRRVLAGLLSIVDDSTRAMFWRSVTLRQLQRECPHDGSWLMVGEHHASCDCCGRIALKSEYPSLIRWAPPPAEPPAEALGTALAEWIGGGT